jgi:hypothetical protein
MDRSEAHRLGRLQQEIFRHVRDGEVEAAISIWDGLTEREQLLTFLSVVGLVNYYRREQGEEPADPAR